MWRAVSYAATLTRYPVRQVYHVANSICEINRMSWTMLQQWTHELPRAKWTVNIRDTVWQSESSRPRRPQSAKADPRTGAARPNSAATSPLRPRESMDRLVSTFSKPRLSEQEVIILPPVQIINTDSQVIPSANVSTSVNRARSIDSLVDVWRSAFTDAAATIKKTGNADTDTTASPTWSVNNSSRKIDTTWAQPKASLGRKAIPSGKSPVTIDAAWAQTKTLEEKPETSNVTKSPTSSNIDVAAPIESHLLKESIARNLMENLPRQVTTGAISQADPLSESASKAASLPPSTRRPFYSDSAQEPSLNPVLHDESTLPNNDVLRKLRDGIRQQAKIRATTQADPLSVSASKAASLPPSTRRPLYSASAQEPSLNPVPHDESPLPNNEDNSQFSLPAEDTVPVPKWWSNLLDKIRRG